MTKLRPRSSMACLTPHSKQIAAERFKARLHWPKLPIFPLPHTALLHGDQQLRESFQCSAKSMRLGIQRFGGRSLFAIDWSCGHESGTSQDLN